MEGVAEVGELGPKVGKQRRMGEDRRGGTRGEIGEEELKLFKIE